MYKTKMVKVYLPSLQLCTFSLMANLLVLGIDPPMAMAQDSPSQPQEQAANPSNISRDLAPEILAEINRVRTNPRGYAHWLEEQRQYYDGSWIRLPGEKPIRTTSRGIKALNEAIASLKQLQPLPPLAVSEEITALAEEKLDDFATANNIQFISYGRTTPKGIVMSLVVDELFPDRRRRNSLLSSDASDTGVVCKPDPRYAKVCAIAYSDSAVEPATSPADTPAQDATVATATSPEAETLSEPPEPPEESTKEAEEPPTAATLPEPPQPQAPAPPDATTPEEAIETEETIKETQETAAVAEDTPPSPPVDQPPSVEEEPAEVAETPTSTQESTQEKAPEAAENPPPEPPVDQPPSTEEEAPEEVVVDAPPSSEAEVAVNSTPPSSDNSQILKNVERGVLEDGDRVIAEDGSFYDSYPLEAKSGESFIIYLESDEFDAFVALIDTKGNIIEQNDDISESDSNSRIRVTIPEDGTYNIIVNAYDEGGRGKYILTVRH